MGSACASGVCAHSNSYAKKCKPKNGFKIGSECFKDEPQSCETGACTDNKCASAPTEAPTKAPTPPPTKPPTPPPAKKVSSTTSPSCFSKTNVRDWGACPPELANESSKKETWADQATKSSCTPRPGQTAYKAHCDKANSQAACTGAGTAAAPYCAWAPSTSSKTTPVPLPTQAKAGAAAGADGKVVKFWDNAGVLLPECKTLFDDKDFKTWLDGKFCRELSAKVCDKECQGTKLEQCKGSSPFQALGSYGHKTQWYGATPGGTCEADESKGTLEVKYVAGPMNYDCETMQEKSNDRNFAQLQPLSTMVLSTSEKVASLKGYESSPSTLLAAAQSMVRNNAKQMLDAIIHGFQGSAIIKSLKDAEYWDKKFGDWKCTRVKAGTARGFLCEASKGSCGLRSCKGMVGTAAAAGMKASSNPIVKQAVCPNFGKDAKCAVTKYAVTTTVRDSPAEEEKRIKEELETAGSRRRRRSNIKLSSCRRRAKSCGKVCCKKSTDCPADQSCQGMGRADWQCYASDSSCTCKDDEGKCSGNLGSVSTMKVATSIDSGAGAVNSNPTCDNVKVGGQDRPFVEQVMHF